MEVMTTDLRTAPWWGLESIAAAGPEEIWAHHHTNEITYARLRREIDAVHRVLGENAITAGSTVAVQLPPGLTLMWWLFALWSAGATVLLLDPRMKPAESAATLARVRPQHLVSSTTPADPVAGFAAECDTTVRPLPDGLPGDPDIALMQCSSGSTGVPKIVARTGRSLLADVDRHVANPGMPVRGERVYLLSPPTHAFGLAAGVLHSLRVGATLVLPGRMLPDDLLTHAVRADVHAILGVPLHFDLHSQAAGGKRPPSLRLAISCGDRLSAAVKERFALRYGIALGQAYGMSEVGCLTTDLTGALDTPAVGRVLPGVEIRITDGELFIKAERSPYPYTDHQDRYTDGWLRTFDRAELEPGSGVLRLLGRSDSLCNIGGLKVDLTEIEAVLRQHPHVRDALVLCHTSDSEDLDHPPVIEAHVAAPDGTSGEQLSAWCRERLSDFKVPRRWHIGGDLPRTALGKTDRKASR
jgi:acyl-CoA synthetase (AMP-forming)/AMP-acid ligase II